MENHSFDCKTGRLAVDYESWIAKQNIVYKRPILDPADAAMTGTGKIGAAIWNAQDLNLQVTAVDSSPHTSYSSGWISLETTPSMKGSGRFHQEMNLYEATVDTTFGENTKTRVFGSPEEELMGIQVEDSRPDVSEIRLTLSMWDTSGLVQKRLWNTCDDFEEWKEVFWENQPDYAMLTRGKHTKHGFGYALAVTVDGAAFRIEQLDALRTVLIIQPTSAYTIWIANPCRVDHPDESDREAVERLFAKARKQTAAGVLQDSRKYWRRFWQQSFIEFSDKSENGEYLENTWYDTNYMLAIASRALYPCHFNNGVFRWDGDFNVRWSAYYTFFNQRAINNHWLTANHMEMIRPHLDHILRIVPQLLSDTHEICGLEGLKFPEAFCWDGTGMYDTPNNYTGRIYHDVLENSLLLYQYAIHNHDMEFLREKCYPFMREGVRFYCNRLRYDGEYYHMHDSNSLEMYWDVKDPITDLTSIRVLFPIFIRLCTEYGDDPALCQKAKHVLAHIAPLETAEKDGALVYLPCASPVPEWKNLQNPEMEMMFPMGYVGIDSPDADLARDTWVRRNFDYTIWSPDAAAAARLGMGDVAYDGIAHMCFLHQIRASGFHDDGNGAFESNGLVTCAVNEMLLQSYDETIRVFPALPSNPNFQASFTLHAMGGFLVTSEYRNQQVQYVGIRSEYGEPLKIHNPWGEERVRLICCTGEPHEILVTNAKMICAGTLPDHVYILERISNPISGMQFTVKKGIPNHEPRHLHDFHPGANDPSKRAYYRWKTSPDLVRTLGYDAE